MLEMVPAFESFLKRRRVCTLKHNISFELYHHDDDDVHHHHLRCRRPRYESVFCPLKRTKISISRAKGDVTLGEGKEWLWGGGSE